MAQINTAYDLLYILWTLDAAAVADYEPWYIRSMTPGMIRVLIEGMDKRDDPDLWTVFRHVLPGTAARVLAQKRPRDWSPRLLGYLRETIDRGS